MFPHISAKIQEGIDRLVRKTFRDVRNAVHAVLELIVSDVNMALASNPPRVDSPTQEDHEEERRKEELMAEIRELKGKHEELLASISNIL